MIVANMDKVFDFVDKTLNFVDKLGHFVDKSREFVDKAIILPGEQSFPGEESI
jgi:hypothetical protein